MCTHNFVCGKNISSTSLGDYFCGGSQGRSKRNIMQALKVTKQGFLSRTVTLTPSQLLSDELHKTNVQRCTQAQSEKHDSTNAIKSGKSM